MQMQLILLIAAILMILDGERLGMHHLTTRLIDIFGILKLYHIPLIQIHIELVRLLLERLEKMVGVLVLLLNIIYGLIRML